jgi:hypothetical protein
MPAGQGFLSASRDALMGLLLCPPQNECLCPKRVIRHIAQCAVPFAGGVDGDIAEELEAGARREVLALLFDGAFIDDLRAECRVEHVRPEGAA